MFNAMSSRIAILFLLIASQMATAQQTDTEAGDQMIADYFAAETKKLTNRVLGNVTSVDDWKRRQPELRRQLLDMLGLHPLPKRGELDIVVTGEIKEDTFTVKKLHFQSVPGFYVTANLYEPEKIDDRLPAILYVCGHGKVEENGVSYGNKVHYHHHGSWFARNGYVCLTIDTLQLGEIEGIHHGTYREKMWWWLNRGYTPAGVEAWNCMRAIDFLQTLDNVDPDRIGVTGRSGGGAYSWWIAAIDERIKCAVPVAGITDLQNHVVDGVVEGHCDCMFMVNTYRWDYPVVAALVAPRPLLISNTDRDSIFPLDGVYRTFTKVRDIYDLHGASDKVALHITAGTHKDTQELRMHAFRWLNHHLKGDDALIVTAAEKYFEPEQLRVFAELPRDQINTTIQETFVPVARPKMPNDATEWKRMTNEWRAKLLAHTFAGWPRAESTPKPKRVFRYSNNKTNLQAFDFSPAITYPATNVRLDPVGREGDFQRRTPPARPSRLEPIRNKRECVIWRAPRCSVAAYGVQDRFGASSNLGGQRRHRLDCTSRNWPHRVEPIGQKANANQTSILFAWSNT